MRKIGIIREVDKLLSKKQSEMLTLCFQYIGCTNNITQASET